MSYDTNNAYKLLGYSCIAELSKNEEPEPVIVGKYGMIYKYNAKEYQVVFWSSQVAKRWGIDITKGEEGSILVDEAKAKKIRKELKTFRSLDKQSAFLQSINLGILPHEIEV